MTPQTLRTLAWTFAAVLGTFYGPHARADWAESLELESRGQLGMEIRAFTPNGDAQTEDFNAAVAARLRVEMRPGPFRVRLRGFARHDETDTGRSAAFPEEAWIEWKEGPLRIRAGFDMFTWTATEAFHPADVLNSRYLDSNVENFEKIGELMASARLKFWEGNIAAYVMPRYTDPIFPSARSRLSLAPAGLPIGEVVKIDGDGRVASSQYGLQWAIRLQQMVGNADVSLHAIRQMDRFHPSFALTASNDAQLVFQTVTQLGGTYQQAMGDLLVKVEAAYRSYVDPNATEFGPDRIRWLTPPTPNHGIAAVGFEYPIYHDNGWESRLLLEGQSVFAEGKGIRGNKAARNQLELFQRDVLMGWRLSFLDILDKTLMALAIVDLETPDRIFANVMYSQRLTDVWSISTGIRIINFPSSKTAPSPFTTWDGANQAFLNVFRNF